MDIRFDERELAADINCKRIEFCHKPTLMRAAVDAPYTLAVCVDMVNGFCKEGALASARCASVSENIAKVFRELPLARRVFVRDCHRENCTEFKWFPPHCHTDRESRVIEDLKEFVKGAVDVCKNSTNGFMALSGVIENFSAYNNVVLMGVCTDICILQLALSLRAYYNERNLPNNVIVLTDCIETYDAPLHNADFFNLAALCIMEQSGIQLFRTVV